MTAEDVYGCLVKYSKHYHWGQILVPEFTYGNLRIDAMIVDTHHRWLRGFEIKISRSDFLQDQKWQEYSCFLSSLCIVCPEGLIEKKEIPKPFGLAYVQNKEPYFRYVSNCKNFQKREALAWKNLYLRVIEMEFVRLYEENKYSTIK